MSNQKFYITFGSDHTDKAGHNLFKYYTTVDAKDEDEARSIITKNRKNKWAFIYPSALAAGTLRYKLSYVPLSIVALPS